MLAGEPYGFENPFSGSPGWEARYGTQEVSQFRAAEMIAEKWDVSRESMEEFAVESHQRALRARAEGRFDREIEPLNGLSALQELYVSKGFPEAEVVRFNRLR